MQTAARAAGHVCMVIDVDGYDGDEAVADLLDRGVTGIVHASAGTGPVTVNRQLGEARELFVGCWPRVGGAGEGTVLPDDREGGRRAAAHLLDLGHRDIAFLGGPADDFAAGEREAGLDDALRAASADPARVVRRNGDYGSRSGYRITNELFDTGRPTALVCGNDQMALGALLALHERGLRVPDDVSIVGYDDQEALADAIHPTLTTVRLPHREMGLRAAELLVKPPSDTPHEELVDCPLVVRESTGAPINTY
jgi:LacI family transcriptional regulator